MSNIPYLSSRAVRSATRALLVTAAATAAGVAAPAWAAMPDEPQLGVPQDSAERADIALADARLYIAEERPAHALRSLAEVMRGESFMTDSARRNEVMGLLGKAKSMRSSQPASQQRVETAQIALLDGNFTVAEHNATAVLAMTDAYSADRQAASQVIADVDAQRTAIAPQIPDLLLAMSDDFSSGQYARAKAALDALQRSGIELNPAQQSSVDHYTTTLYELERVNGVIDHTPYAATMLQAGVVKRRAEEPDEPAQVPATEEPALEEPVAQPAPAKPLTRSAGTMDPIEMALGGSTTPPPAAKPAIASTTAQPVTQATPAQAARQDDPEIGTMTPVNAPQKQTPPPSTSQPVQQPAVQPSVQPMTQSTPPGRTPAMGSMQVQESQLSSQQASGSLIDQALRIEAQSTIANADAAFEKAQYARAEGMYFTAQQYSQYLTSAQMQHISDRLAESRLQLGDNGGNILDGELQTRGAQADRARAIIANQIDQAQTRLDTGLIELAQTNAEGARSDLLRNQDVLSASEFQAFSDQIDTLIAAISRRDLEQADSTARDQERDALRAAQSKEAERIIKKEVRLREALDRVRALQAERRYQAALAVVEQDILFIDPLNPAGLLLQDILREADIYRVFNANRKEMNLRLSELANQNAAAVLPPTEILDYPENWPSLSTTRLGGLGDFETAEDRATLGKLGLRPVEARFAANRLSDVLDFVSAVAEVAIDVDWRSLEEIGIDPETEVTLNLPPVTPERILNAVADRVSDIGAEADWAVQDGVLVFASKDRLRKRRALHIYDIGDLVVEVPDYTSVPEIDLQQALQSNEGGGQSPFQDQNQDTVRIPLEDRIREVRDIIERNVDTEHWDVDGFIQEWGKSLIINTSPKNHREVRGLLSQLRDQRAIQINAEVRFLLVSQDFFEQIGFDFDVYLNANNNQVRTARAGDPTINASDFFSFSPTGGGAAGLQRTVTGSAAPNGPVAGGGGALTQGVVAPRPWSPIGFPSNSIGLTEALFPAEGIASQVLSAAPALGIAGQFLDDIQVDFLIQATQADRRTVTLTAPRLTFMNGQIANIVVGTQIAFISDLQPVVSDSAVGFDPELDTVVEGVTLLLEGTVSADRRYVQMNVDAAVAEVIGIANEEVVAVAGGQLVSSAQASSFIGLPTTTVTRVQTTVNVPDQGTALLGGQRIVSESEVETGVPILSKIPILNRFFSNRIESRDESTLMILLKPTILIQGEQEERQHPGIGSELSRSYGG